jgi:hypothetical protein
MARFTASALAGDTRFDAREGGGQQVPVAGERTRCEGRLSEDHEGDAVARGGAFLGEAGHDLPREIEARAPLAGDLDVDGAHAARRVDDQHQVEAVAGLRR